MGSNNDHFLSSINKLTPSFLQRSRVSQAIVSKIYLQNELKTENCQVKADKSVFDKDRGRSD